MKTCLVLTPKKSKFSPLLFAGKMDHGIKRASELGYDGIEINIKLKNIQIKIDTEN